MTTPILRRNAGRRRFEAEVDGSVAGFINYRDAGDALDLVHTEVLPGHQGQGLADRLAQFALGEAEREGRKVVPSCSFVAAYLQRHPEYQGLVAA